MNGVEGKLCPNDGKKMLLRSAGRVLLTYPLQYPQEWWCGWCYHKEAGPTLQGKTQEQVDKEAWEALNP